GDFYFYSFRAAPLTFAKSVKQNFKKETTLQIYILFFHFQQFSNIFIKILGGGNLLIFNALW
ncbi:MAG: hypothetical protein MJZ22_05785, partial [Candidatus Saccharibacteria bacterium]|nr:hypothetical protein [Candidatus Saccharibacteria bacterium]